MKITKEHIRVVGQNLCGAIDRMCRDPRNVVCGIGAGMLVEIVTRCNPYIAGGIAILAATGFGWGDYRQRMRALSQANTSAPKP